MSLHLSKNIRDLMVYSLFKAASLLTASRSAFGNHSTKSYRLYARIASFQVVFVERLTIIWITKHALGKIG